MSYLSNPEEQVKDYSERFKLLYIAVAVTFVIFGIRLWYLQLFRGTEYRFWSEENRIKRQKVPAPRGMILDREGRVLVDNQPGFDVVITPQYSQKTLDETAKIVSEILGVEAKSIVKMVKQGKRKDGAFKPVIIKKNLTRDEVARIERIRLNHPGLRITMPIKRTYLLKENGAQLFGYVGEITKRQLKKFNEDRVPEERFEQGDLIGQNGIESFYDETLRGRDGTSYVQVDAFGREAQLEVPDIFQNFQQLQDSEPGKSMILTIDRDIQEAAYNAFVGTERIGGLVAIENKTGKILAWVSSPSFDPSHFWPKIPHDEWVKLINDPFKPLRNKVIQDHHAPGSTFKAIVALAALQEKVIDINTTHFCPGYLRFGRRTYHCHARGGHGNVSIVQALERSCNVFFFKMGIALGINKIAKYARALGMGSLTGIKFKNEVPGLIPDTDWKKKRFGEEWQPGENLSNAIGQGFILTTPLQLAMTFSGIANGGPYYKPYFIDKILNVDGQVVKQMEPELSRNPTNKLNTEVQIDPQNYEIVRKGLWSVSNGERGTAKWYKIPGVELSGKSGTTQIISLAPDQVYVKCKTRPIQLRHHGWFVGYAPYKNPEITVAVLAEHSCSGSGGGAPVVRDVIRSYIEKYRPELLKKKRVAVIKEIEVQDE